MTRRDDGQATVEFVLILPLVMVCIAVLVYAAAVVRTAIAVHEGAHRAARVASLDPDPDAARQAAAQVLPGIEVVVTRGEIGSSVRANARARVRPRIPVLRRVLPEIALTANAEMRAER